MLAKRVILSLCLSEGQLTRTKLFRPDRWYPLNYVDLELADEIVLLDVTRPDPMDLNASLGTGAQREKFWTTVRDFSRNLFVPLSVGGFLRSMDDVKRAFAEGADKVVINTGILESPGLLEAVANKYGNQAAVCSIDVRNNEVFSRQGTRPTGYDPVGFGQACVARGSGEIILMDITRDGSLQGYNLPLITAVSHAVPVPVVAVGGCGNWSHMADGFAAGADACATSVIFHLTATSLRACKTYLAEKGLEVRL